MRTFYRLDCFGGGTVAVALPAVTANAQDRTVVITKQGHHYAVFIVGGRAVITMAGAITMPRSWSLRRTDIITTIDCFWIIPEQEPGRVAGFFASSPLSALSRHRFCAAGLLSA